MTILGVVGGIAPISTVQYYRQLVAGYRARYAGDEYPQILINSINLRRMLELVTAGDMAALAVLMGREVCRLADAGATVALFASNTPHLAFDEIEAVAPIPLISIVRATRNAARQRRLTRLCLLGNRFLMTASIYQRELATAGIEVVVPDERDREIVDTIYMKELVQEVFRDTSREEMLRVVDRVAARSQIDGVILGGTELPLLLPMSSYGNYPLLNTMGIHVEEALSHLLTSPAAPAGQTP
jgi:aspartate racemase